MERSTLNPFADDALFWMLKLNFKSAHRKPKPNQKLSGCNVIVSTRMYEIDVLSHVTHT